MDLGYMLFIQMCGLFWKNPSKTGKPLKLNLINTFNNQEFLGICAEMWRFMPAQAKERWQEEARVAISASKKANLVAEIEYLAQITINYVNA